MSSGEDRRRRGATAAMIAAAVLIAAAIVVGLVLVLSPASAPRPPATATTPTGPTGPVRVPPRPALAAPAGEQFGINVNLLYNDLSYSPAQIAAQLTAVRATGVTVARSDVLWQAAEPHPPTGDRHQFAWGFDDQIAGSLATAGLTWQPILDYSAPWAESIPGQDHSPPSSNADFATFAGAFAARYGPGGTFWHEHPSLTATPVTTIEVWNEPDNGQFWPPQPDAGRYAALYLAARDAIDAVAPQIRVIIGGLVDAPAFVPAMLHAAPALAGHIDGVAIHPYGRPLVLLGKVRAARAALVKAGLGSVPLYVTEFGWTTNPPGAIAYAPAAHRAGYITAAIAALAHARCGVTASFLYTWVTPGKDTANPEDWYGIADPTDPMLSTPDTAAFTAAVRAAASGGGAPASCGG